MVAESDRETTYDIITVDWNPDQTKLWRYHVEKNCPTANIITIPENRPVKWSKYSPKLNCLLHDFKNKSRIMYMDTDCIVTGDLEVLFEYMEECNFDLGISEGFLPKMSPFTGRHSKSPEIMTQAIKEMFVDRLPPHYSSGMMLFRPGIDLRHLYEQWIENFTHQFIVNTWGGIGICEEIALSFALERLRYKTWFLPREVHGNICGKPFDFGNTDTPMVIHYHKIWRFSKKYMDKYIKVDMHEES